MSTLAERNSIRKMMAEKDARIEELTQELAQLNERYNDKCTEYDSITVRYEDETGLEWDGRAFKD